MPKSFQENNVYEAGLERIRRIYATHDDVVVWFSGGKDSTALLFMVKEVARELGKLPVKTVHMDEEAIHPPTVNYVQRVSEDPELDFEWYCLEVKHRNACSTEEPYWYCWDRNKESLWTRPLPKKAITEHKDFIKGMSIPDFSARMYKGQNVCQLMGIRTQESLRRYRIIAQKKGIRDAYVTNSKVRVDLQNKTHAYYLRMTGYPIYDMSSVDVWKVVKEHNLDYNKTYDLFNKTKLFNSLLIQRVCPPYGEEPLRGLWVYAECFPELWHKMLYRVKGVATAWRYANTELYNHSKKPDAITWREYLKILVENYSGKYNHDIKYQVNMAMKEHYSKTTDKIPEQEPHLLTGCSYKFLCKMVGKGDFKGRKRQGMIVESDRVLKKQGISLKTARITHGKK